MDIQSTNQQSATDDQELAKVLAGVNEQIEKDQSGDAATELHFEETPTPGISAAVGAAPTPYPVAEPVADPVALPSLPTVLPEPVVQVPAEPDPLSVAPVSDALDSIKKDALNELRPLVDKLNVSSEEKFDTYLLLLRSTDDQSLIAPAHDAAKGITDEARRAQALLDVIKEIDYLSNPHAA